MTVEPKQPHQIADYIIERELGRGLFDVTYLSRKQNGDRWMLKVLDLDFLRESCDSESERERIENKFWQEAWKLANCNISYIVKADEPFREGRFICLPIEHLSGRNLSERPTAILNETIALRYIRQIAKALKVVHEKGLVHRDIRPDNIFLRIRQDNSTEAVLTNFALAVECNTELTRTRENEIIDGFSPLELYGRNRSIEPYTDIYSLSATLYNLLTGEIPPSAETRKCDNIKLISPQAKNEAISKKTSQAILAGMELSPNKRPQSISKWLSMLGGSNILLPPSRRYKNWNWNTIWVAVGAMAAIASIFISPYLSKNQSSPKTKPDVEKQQSFLIEKPSKYQNSFNIQNC